MIFHRPSLSASSRRIRTRARKFSGLGLVILLLTGLAVSAAPKKPAAPPPVWPPPPADPYVVYVRDIANPDDIGAKAPALKRFANWITGVGADSMKLEKPFGLSVDEAGNLLVADTGANAVCFLDLARKKWLRWKSVGGQPLKSPVAAVHLGKTFFVADPALGKVIAFDEKGRLEFEITSELERPAGLALLNDRLVIADSQRHQIIICDAHGGAITRFGQRGAGPGEFNHPTHVSVDTNGRIYVTDSLNSRVQVFDAGGRFLRTFGRVGDGPGCFSRPKGVAVDRAGHVYVVDALFDNVQIFDEQGRLLLDFGAAGHAAGEFWLPNAIAINSQNEIFVADAYNHRIQMFRYTGKP